MAAASPAEAAEEKGPRIKTREELKRSRGVDFDTGAFYQEAFQNPWADYVEPTETPSFISDLMGEIIRFFRGNMNPKTPCWKTRVVWYSGGSGNDVPGQPICEWTGTQVNLDQFARIDNYRGEVNDDLNNHTYAVMVDSMIPLRNLRTLIGQIDTRSEHSTGSFIECVVGIAYAHVTQGWYLHDQGGGFIEIEPIEARDILDDMWDTLQFLGFGPRETEATPFGSKVVQRWASVRMYKPRTPDWWGNEEEEAKVQEEFADLQRRHDELRISHDKSVVWTILRIWTRNTKQRVVERGIRSKGGRGSGLKAVV